MNVDALLLRELRGVEKAIEEAVRQREVEYGVSLFRAALKRMASGAFTFAIDGTLVEVSVKRT